MKIVPASYEIYEIPEATDKSAVLKHLERIARVCYKSEDKITDESAEKMMNALVQRKHWAMLEHYNFVMITKPWVVNSIDKLKSMLSTAPVLDYTADDADVSFAKLANALNYVRTSVDPDLMTNIGFSHKPVPINTYIVSCSATTINNIIDCINELGERVYKYLPLSGIYAIFRYIDSHFTVLIKHTNYYPPDDKISLYDKPSNDIYNNGTYQGDIQFATNDMIKNMSIHSRLLHQFQTVKFTTDRGVSHEIVRHRPSSYAQESTRYCNYSKEGFGNEITVIDPLIANPDMSAAAYDAWKMSCESVEKFYMRLSELGLSPQFARLVLPNSLKTEIVMSANLNEWLHFFKMRVPSAAHPQMREISRPLFKDMIEKMPEIFEEYRFYLEETEVTK